MKKDKNIKVCLFLQRRFAFWGHALAREFKELGVNQFSCYTLPYKSAEFLKSQKDIKYDPFVIDEDVIKNYKEEKIDFNYLLEIEKKYGIPNLWPYIFMERFIVMSKGRTSYEPAHGYEDSLKLLQLRFKAITKMLEEVRPDVVIFSSIALMSALIMQQVAKQMGIKVMYIETTKVKDRVSILENPQEYTSIIKLFKKINSGRYRSKCRKDALNFLKEFRSNPSEIYNPGRKKSTSFLLLRIYRMITFPIKYIIKYYTTSMKDDYVAESPREYFTKRGRKKLNTLLPYSGLFQKPNFKENYVFFPLHVEPEMAILVLAPYHVNQIEVIRNIALSLPINYKLYVKDHPLMFRRKWSYYKKILRIPNVCLIDTRIPSAELVKHAKVITTITGTAGWEGLLLGKPVITFGNAFYNLFSSVKHCDNIEKLPFLINECLNDFKYNEREVINYLSALFEESISFDKFRVWNFDKYEDIVKERRLKELAEFLYKKMKSNLQITQQKNIKGGRKESVDDHSHY